MTTAPTPATSTTAPKPATPQVPTPISAMGVQEFRGKLPSLEGREVHIVGYLGSDLRLLYDTSEHARVGVAEYSICLDFRDSSFAGDKGDSIRKLSDYYVGVSGRASQAIPGHLGSCQGVEDIHEIVQESSRVQALPTATTSGGR